MMIICLLIIKIILIGKFSSMKCNAFEIVSTLSLLRNLYICGKMKVRNLYDFIFLKKSYYYCLKNSNKKKKREF